MREVFIISVVLTFLSIIGCRYANTKTWVGDFLLGLSLVSSSIAALISGLIVLLY